MNINTKNTNKNNHKEELVTVTYVKVKIFSNKLGKGGVNTREYSLIGGDAILYTEG